MPKIITLVAVNYEAQAFYVDEEAYERGDDPTGVHLKFADPASGELYVVQFDKLPWQGFKRHIESDGKVNAPQIVVPDTEAPRRMDIPRGRQR